MELHICKQMCYEMGVYMKDFTKTIERTVNFIEQHLQDDLNLNDIAKYIGYSKYHLNRIFSETVGCTIHKYIQKRRLTEAARMLVYTNIPIAQIALESSYESQQAFTLAFRGAYFKTPQLYRKNREFLPLQQVFGAIPGEQQILTNMIYYTRHYKKEMKAA